MGQGNESKGPAILFFGLWWMIAANTPYGDSAFLLALALMLIAWLSIRFFSVARTRLGEHAWAVLAQAVALVIGIFLIYPGPPALVIFWLWTLGPFLVFAAAALRIAIGGSYVVEGFIISRAVYVAGGLALAFGCVALWNGVYFISGMVWGAGATLALVIGWQFGAPPTSRGRFDARMGDAESFGKEGMWHER
jgi:hypothetical protein